MVATVENTMSMNDGLMCPANKLSTCIWSMTMDFSVWIYNQIPDMQSDLSAFEILSRSKFEPVSETISNCHVWGCRTYVLEPNFQNPGVKLPKWDPRSDNGLLWYLE